MVETFCLVIAPGKLARLWKVWSELKHEANSVWELPDLSTVLAGPNHTLDVCYTAGSNADRGNVTVLSDPHIGGILIQVHYSGGEATMCVLGTVVNPVTWYTLRPMLAAALGCIDETPGDYFVSLTLEGTDAQGRPAAEQGYSGHAEVAAKLRQMIS